MSELKFPRRSGNIPYRNALSIASLAFMVSATTLPALSVAQSNAPSGTPTNVLKNGGAAAAGTANAPAVRPARTVTLVAAKLEDWPEQIEAQGHVMPWQETRVGTEIGGLRLLSLLVNVGDVVKKGQPLAVIEAMKIEHTINAPADGTVTELLFKAGDLVSDGDELLKLDTGKGE